MPLAIANYSGVTIVCQARSFAPRLARNTLTWERQRLAGIWLPYMDELRSTLTVGLSCRRHLSASGAAPQRDSSGVTNYLMGFGREYFYATVPPRRRRSQESDTLVFLLLEVLGYITSETRANMHTRKGLAICYSNKAGVEITLATFTTRIYAITSD
jgi:hypothetical protein